MPFSVDNDLVLVVIVLAQKVIFYGAKGMLAMKKTKKTIYAKKYRMIRYLMMPYMKP